MTAIPKLDEKLVGERTVNPKPVEDMPSVLRDTLYFIRGANLFLTGDKAKLIDMEDVNTQCLKWRPKKIRLMNKELSVLGITMSILLFAITTSSVTAQNATTNASNAVGNASASVNQTSSEVGQNMSTAVGNAGQTANQTMSELGANASNAMNETGEVVNATANEVGKNASDIGSTILNKTAEVGKKIIGGAATVLGNISGEMKKP